MRASSPSRVATPRDVVASSSASRPRTVAWSARSSWIAFGVAGREAPRRRPPARFVAAAFFTVAGFEADFLVADFFVAADFLAPPRLLALLVFFTDLAF